MRVRYPVIVLAIALLAASGAFAAPVVIHDAGGTLPLRPLADASGFVPDEEDARLAEQEAGATVEHAPYRIESTGLSPGRQPRIATGDAGRVLPRPLFVIGADPGSLGWLRAHHARLVELGAVGLLVQAAGEADVVRARQAAGELPLALGSGEMLAERFGLRHYPVLIGPEWIEQ